jgi:type I restriction enzyme R subunit
VLARVINSMVEFKQIIGRGTRLRDDYGKLFFNILDFTQSTRLFADPEFDGDPVLIDETQIDEDGNATDTEETEEHQPDPWGAFPDDGPGDDVGGVGDDDGDGRRRKYYFDGGQVEIAAHMVYEIDPDGHQLRVVKYTDYTAEKVRTLYPNAHALRQSWSHPENRGEIIEALAERGIDFEQLVEVSGQPDADPFDLLCHVAFNAPLRTRRERA